MFSHSSRVYQMTTYFTLIASVVDGLNASPAFISTSTVAKTIISFGENYLPLFSIGMGWVLPASIGFVIGLLWHFIKRR